MNKVELIITRILEQTGRSGSKQKPLLKLIEELKDSPVTQLTTTKTLLNLNQLSSTDLVKITSYVSPQNLDKLYLLMRDHHLADPLNNSFYTALELVLQSPNLLSKYWLDVCEHFSINEEYDNINQFESHLVKLIKGVKNKQLLTEANKELLLHKIIPGKSEVKKCLLWCAILENDILSSDELVTYSEQYPYVFLKSLSLRVDFGERTGEIFQKNVKKLLTYDGKRADMTHNTLNRTLLFLRSDALKPRL